MYKYALYKCKLQRLDQHPYTASPRHDASGARQSAPSPVPRPGSHRATDHSTARTTRAASIVRAYRAVRRQPSPGRSTRHHTTDKSLSSTTVTAVDRTSAPPCVEGGQGQTRYNPSIRLPSPRGVPTLSIVYSSFVRSMATRMRTSSRLRKVQQMPHPQAPAPSPRPVGNSLCHSAHACSC